MRGLGVRLPRVPLSLARIGDVGLPLRREARSWAEELAPELAAAAAPDSLSEVRATALVTFGDDRRRNPANFAPVLERAVAYALVDTGVIADPGALAFDGVTITAKGEPATTIELRWGGP